MISMIVAAAISQAQAQPADRAFEGDWYVSDDTDNNTGERKVYSFLTYIRRGDPNFVTVTMRCSNGKPTLFIEWHDLAFPDQAVLTIGPVAHPDAEPLDGRYVFEKSEDTIERGLRASAASTAQIVAAIGEAKYMMLTAHLPAGSRTIGIDVAGTQRAWSRVSRHCPIRITPRPPL